ncbi:MAG: histidine kinase dimerization/phospho-acceptor domain-containing protein [Candidatus Devosia phytovorans]|uniref:histidine kinase n=1 Tax=Candidatus Devosia phytovorans TaxID=3121372 RepID=A0AAJ5VR22_9HYPH|nr:histidine kinase dimerization/phospho-acceptor domain-containing protein [Devosia sp.]WEK03163.1 MAG: histidine kinase dimerization/phospho-acceptor domain-containing protein [Devosia sp.]
MDADWITSPSARRVLQHAGDSRPAWLWSQDGQVLLWQNDAAELFLAKLKKSGLKLAQPALPIKGQIARNIRLGSPGRTSLARIQFLAGEKPASSTCATTPLQWQDGQMVLLIVGVDPIDAEILAAAAQEGDAPGATASAVEADDLPVGSEETAVEPAELPYTVEDDVAAAQEALDEPEHVEPEAEVTSTEVASDETAYAQELENWRAAGPDGTAELEVVPEAAVPDEAQDEDVEQAEASEEAPKPSRLSLLVDRLAADEGLFTPLTAADDTPPVTTESIEPESDAASPALFKVTGRGFVADDATTEMPIDEVADESDEDLADLAALDGADDVLDEAETEPEAGVDVAVEDETAVDVPVAVEDETPDPPPAAETVAEEQPGPIADPEQVERASRYNFDELARILTDRVGEPAATPAAANVIAAPARSGSLINLGGETLVLNRLPLGILVFRDQQVLFANRAITEMVGYESVESLRAAGLGAVFPAAGPEGEGSAGPVNHLVQRDGTLVPVTARLQSISWQGKPALMLSASTTEVRTGHEAAVAAFARAFAEQRQDGYFETNRAGTISLISPRAKSLLKAEAALEGKPLSALLAASDLAELRDFLERPARFAETARPALTLRPATGAAEIMLFAQGQAGVVTGYFGLVRGRDIVPARVSGPSDADPALLSRISRGVRRPLNSIIGFADLLRGEAQGNERLQGYAQDIGTAGQEIASLVDELDDYARLRDGRYLPQRASIELTSLLESCVLRIRPQASNARVIVRNAISETLPRVTADRASLAQAVLNLLASAIDQTPTGGGVVISAQREDDGSIAVHVRDSSNNAVDMAERFVVFRDGLSRDGQMMVPVRSSIGLALTRSLLAVNAFSLSVDPAGEQGMLFTMIIPAELVEDTATPQARE